MTINHLKNALNLLIQLVIKFTVFPEIICYSPNLTLTWPLGAAGWVRSKVTYISTCHPLNSSHRVNTSQITGSSGGQGCCADLPWRPLRSHHRYDSIQGQIWSVTWVRTLELWHLLRSVTIIVLWMPDHSQIAQYVLTSDNRVMYSETVTFFYCLNENNKSHIQRF